MTFVTLLVPLTQQGHQLLNECLVAGNINPRSRVLNAPYRANGIPPWWVIFPPQEHLKTIRGKNPIVASQR
jgi:hypothetical protein